MDVTEKKVVTGGCVLMSLVGLAYLSFWGFIVWAIYRLVVWVTGK